MQGFRLSMEDQHSTDVNVDIGELANYIDNNDNLELCFFGVYDGHSGQSCAKYLAQVLLKNTLSDETQHRKEQRGRLFSDDDVIKRSYLKTDMEFTRNIPSTKPGESSGTTCTSVFLVRNGDEVEIICANVGDSRTVMRRSNGTVVPLSYDHKPTNKEEKARIQESGGFVEFGRVNGSLALSRAFGDVGYKNNSSMPQERQAVIALPDIIRQKVQLSKIDGFEFVLVACDGVWDVMSNEEACDYIYKKLVQQKAGNYYQARLENNLRMLQRQGEPHEVLEKQRQVLEKQHEERSKNGQYDLESIAEDLLDEVVLVLDSKDNISACIVLLPGSGKS